LEESVRTEARALQVAIAPETAPSVAAATEQGAAVAVTGKAVRLEGALAVTLAVVKTGDGARLATERLVGFTLADLQGDGRKKIPRLLRAGLGLEPPPPAAPPAPPAPRAPAPAATVPTGPAATSSASSMRTADTTPSTQTIPAATPSTKPAPFASVLPQLPPPS